MKKIIIALIVFCGMFLIVFNFNTAKTYAANCYEGNQIANTGDGHSPRLTISKVNDDIDKLDIRFPPFDGGVPLNGMEYFKWNNKYLGNIYLFAKYIDGEADDYGCVNLNNFGAEIDLDHSPDKSHAGDPNNISMGSSSDNSVWGSVQDFRGGGGGMWAVFNLIKKPFSGAVNLDVSKLKCENGVQTNRITWNSDPNATRYAVFRDLPGENMGSNGTIVGRGWGNSILDCASTKNPHAACSINYVNGTEALDTMSDGNHTYVARAENSRGSTWSANRVGIDYQCQAVMSVAPNTISLVGAIYPDQQGEKSTTFNISNAGGASLAYSISTETNKPWLTIDKPSGTINQGATVPINAKINIPSLITSLGGAAAITSAREQTARITVAGAGVTSNVNVNLSVNKLKLTVSQTANKDYNKLQLAWLNLGDQNVTKYKIFNGDGTYTGKEVPITAGGEAITYEMTGLEAGKEYSYYLQAVNAKGEKVTQSETASATTSSAISSLPRPTNPTLTVGNQNECTLEGFSLALTWQYPDAFIPELPPLAGFKIYNADTNALVAQTDKNTKTYTITGLAQDKIYKYYIKALDGFGKETVASDTTTTSTPHCTDQHGTPGNPSNLTATTKDKNSVLLEWQTTDTSNVVGYNIYYTDGVTDAKLITATSETNYILTGLDCEKEYNFYVKSHNIDGVESQASNTAAATTSVCLEKPGNISVSGSGTTFTLSWGAVGGASGYDIYNSDGKYVGSTSNTSYELSGLSCETSYGYKVRAHNNVGQYSEFSELMQITTGSCPLGIPVVGGGSSGSGTAIGSTTELVSTGSSLWFNLLMAIILAAAISYYLVWRPVMMHRG